MLKTFTVADAYSPKILTNTEFQYKGTPVVLVQVQFGAAAARIDAIGVVGDSVRRLTRLEADYFDFVTIRETPFLVAHNGVNELDVPAIYRWNGASFVNDSLNHPDFYNHLANEIRNKSDVAAFAPNVKLRFAKIIEMAGEPAVKKR